MSRPGPETAIGRHFDFRLMSNRIAIGGSLVAFAALAIASFFLDDLTIVGAAFAAVGVFIGWAVSRELDPAMPSAATYAMALALGFAFWSLPGALVAGVTLIGIRLLVGSVGAPLTLVDAVSFVLIGGATMIDPVGWMAAAMMAIWLWTAPEVGDRRRLGQVSFAVGVAGGIAVGLVSTWGESPFDSEITATAYVLAAVAGAAMLFSVRPVRQTAPTDVGGGSIDPIRIRFGRLAAGAACMWAAVIAGVDGFWQLGPIFAALLVAAFYRVFVHPA